MREKQKECFVNFCSLVMLSSLVIEELWGGAESFRAS